MKCPGQRFGCALDRSGRFLDLQMIILLLEEEGSVISATRDLPLMKRWRPYLLL